MTSSAAPPPRPVGRVIDRFTGGYGFLSNFSPSPILMDGTVFPTVEHAFQAAKTEDPAERLRVAEAASPTEAKRLGRQATLRAGWEGVKGPIMLALLRLKFADPDLASLLLETGEAILIEGNHWGDHEWGAVWKAGGWTGQNRLGELLMEVRREIREARAAAPVDRLRFDALGSGGAVRIGHRDQCVYLEVEGAHGQRAAVVLAPSTARSLAAGLTGQAGYAEEEEPTRALPRELPA